MKGLLLAALCVASAALVFARPEGDDEFYTDEFDTIDVHEVFKSERLYKNYIQCFKTKQKCTPAGKKIIEVLPDALQNGCSKCTEVQKDKGEEVVRWVLENKREDFLDIEKQYDPERKYRAKFADRIKKAGIVLPE